MKKIKISKKSRGQVLIIALVVMVVLFITAIVVIESGNLIYEKIHMQNIADSGAMEGGLWYARSLNILSLSNKILLCSAAVGCVLTLFGIEGGSKIPEVVQKLQDVFAGTGNFEKWHIKPAPAMTALMVVRNGWNNGVFSVPLFNTDDFGDQGINPSFNVERTYMSDEGSGKVSFYFKSTFDGQKYTFKENEASYNWDAHRWQLNTCFTVPGTNRCMKRFVTRKVERKGKSSKLVPLTIEETGGHSVLVVSVKTNVKQLLNTGFLKNDKGEDIKPIFLLSAAMTTIDGGSMSIWDIDGARYTPKIRHIILPKIQQAKIFDKLKDYIKYIDILSGQFSNNILLH